ncbi:hypothetical protein [Terricaulis sp.]|uniref:hypothetical protein n=1 Tax=Terricaulis sp. TaxID=2768686 RepID=UPI0037838D0E
MGAVSAQNDQVRRPWLRLWLAFMAINALFAPVSMLLWTLAGAEAPFVGGPVRIAMALSGLLLLVVQTLLHIGANNDTTVIFAGFTTAFVLQAVVFAPLWFLAARRDAWRRGVNDYWSAALTVGLVYAVGMALVIPSAYVGRPPAGRLSDPDGLLFTLSSLLSLIAPTVGGLLGGALVRLVAGASHVAINPSRVTEVAALNVTPIATAGATRDLSPAVRVRERLALINGLLGAVFTSITLMMIIMVFFFALMGVIGMMRQSALSLVRPLALLALVMAAGVAISIPLSWITRIHRRALAAFGALCCVAVIAYGGWRIRRFALAPAHPETPGVRDGLIVDMTEAGLLTLVVFGLMTAMFIGLALAPQSDFMAGRGWRPPARRWLANARRVLGMPNYLGSLGRKQLGPTALFLLSIVFSSFFVAAPFMIATPFGAQGFQLFSIPAQLETNIGTARAICGEYGSETTVAFMQRADAAGPPGSPLSACVQQILSARLGNVWFSPLMMLGFSGFFALVGLAFGRAGLRAATRAYQNVRDWDARAPIVFLRAFRADEARIPAARHGVLPRLSLRPGQPRTLDEIVLDTASPYGPVIAIGRPDEELPPLGAARIYARDGDWQATVTGLCDAAACIVICADASEGVQWELQQIVARGYAQKTVLLISPQLKRKDRRLLAHKLFAVNVSNGDPIGALHDTRGALTALTSKRSSRAAYGVALTIALDALLGEPVPPQPKAG